MKIFFSHFEVINRISLSEVPTRGDLSLFTLTRKKTKGFHVRGLAFGGLTNEKVDETIFVVYF